jgi:hypothetical protein
MVFISKTTWGLNINIMIVEVYSEYVPTTSSIFKIRDAQSWSKFRIPILTWLVTSNLLVFVYIRRKKSKNQGTYLLLSCEDLITCLNTGNIECLQKSMTWKLPSIRR